MTNYAIDVIFLSRFPGDDMKGQYGRGYRDLFGIAIDKLSEAGAKVVIGLGGGAAMDAAKLVAAIAPSGQPAQDSYRRPADTTQHYH